ncbi:MAG: tRNA 2-selenouridine(34) synthase MnmH [Bacteroidetes bacterium]|nr:MAG: tRNA 2-selenouridine(34) synthase MnmH [Bacteroidota bacterium]
MNSPLQIREFLQQAQKCPVIDVRSPGEFDQGHIPGAINIPLFDNEERAKVGTAYVQKSKEEAIRIGYEIANPKIDLFLSKVEKIAAAEQANKRTSEQANDEPLTINHKPLTVLIHCWRGGMRSSKFAQLLNENGYNTYTLVRGYKAYRNFVLQSFNRNADILVVGGETGSGKTEILKHIAAQGEQVIDLEALANHKGSAFGSLGEAPQPTNEQFENALCAAFGKLDPARKIWLEDESRSIGKVQLPAALWARMKEALILRVSVPKSSRIERLVADYGNFSKEELSSCVLKIHQRLGGQHVNRALEELEKGDLHEVADITLTYYDKAYNYNHEKRSMKDVFFIECDSADAKLNAGKVLEYANTKLKKNYA